MTQPNYVGSNQGPYLAAARELMVRIKRIENAIRILAEMAEKAAG